MVPQRPVDDPGVRDADRVRVGDRDGPGERPRLGDPGDPGHLAVAVLAVEAGRYRVGGAGPAVGMDAGDAGPHPGALDQRDVPALDSGHVGDGVPGPGAARERDLQPAGPRAGRRASGGARWGWWAAD